MVRRGAAGPGDDVEAWCTRCKMNLNHRVIAVVASSIQRVHCLTCGGDHKYYPPKGQKVEKAEKVRVKSARTVSERAPKASEKVSPARAASEWSTVMRDMPPETVPTPYRVTESYSPKEFVEHPVFGTGRVLDIVGAERMQVIFKDGRKILICNKKAHS